MDAELARDAGGAIEDEEDAVLARGDDAAIVVDQLDPARVAGVPKRPYFPGMSDPGGSDDGVRSFAAAFATGRLDDGSTETAIGDASGGAARLRSEIRVSNIAAGR